MSAATKSESGFGWTHSVIRKVSTWAIYSFFDTIQVVNAENVPREGPVIVACTHHNMSVDPAVLSVAFPWGRKLHYWAKSTLFGHPLAKYVLLNAGNIPVNRKERDNQVLFRGTFEALAKGEVVAIFPEGTSYTEPRIMQVKDGVSWTALEYLKWLQTPEGAKAKGNEDLVIVPASIVYTDKSRYRSSAIVEFGEPIHISEYASRFLSEEEGAARATVKSLTKTIGTKMVEMTVNAPDWNTLWSAKMARRLLWPNEKKINLEEWVPLSQTLVDLFSEPNPSSLLKQTQTDLLKYYSLLDVTHLTNSALSQLPLPREFDPKHDVPLPSRLRTLLVLLSDTIASAARLPFFLLPLLVHIPAYYMGRLGARLVEDEEESRAQNKIFFSLLSLGLIYPTMFIFLWALFWLTPVGAVIAAITVWAFALYHVRLIDDNYEHAKRLVAAWRVLIGVWGPRRWDLSLAALTNYTRLEPPPPNQWITPPKPSTSTPPSAPSASETKPTVPSPGGTSATDAADDGGKTAKPSKRKRPASRRLVRHTLRARIDAAKSLAAFLADVERSGQNVRAAAHLARQFKGRVDGLEDETHGVERKADDVDFLKDEITSARAWRSSKEVMSYLRSRGAKIDRLVDVGGEHEGGWAAGELSSGEDGETEDQGETEEDLVWVASSAKHTEHE